MLFGRAASDDETVVAMLAAALRRDIAFGTLRPNEKLKIEALRQRYGGSNHSMRETLRLLSADGLVEATAQRGFRVTSATAADLRDICLVRGQVEQAALAMAIRAGDVAWEGRVIAALHALRRAEDRVAAGADDLSALEWDEACRAFSATLIEACGSPRLIDLQKRFYDQARVFRLALLREGRFDFAARRARQDRLLAAVLARDAATAQAALAEEIEDDLRAG